MDNIRLSERIKPDENVIRLTEKILEQNAQILQINAKLLGWLNAPVMIVEAEKTEGVVP